MSGRPHTHRTIVVLLASLALVAAVAQPVRADDTPPADEAIEQGREALASPWIDPPWYDAEQDGLRRVRVWSSLGWEWDLDWLGGTGWVRYVIWGLAGLVLLGILVLLIRVYWYGRRASPLAQASAEPASARGEAMIEALPFPLERRPVNLLDEARRRYEAGDYAQAIVFLFSHQLVELDRRRLIHLTRGKTNRQYLRELLSHPTLHALVEPTMVAFEEVFFGNRPLERERFERCWRGLDQFNAQLQTEAS